MKYPDVSRSFRGGISVMPPDHFGSEIVRDDDLFACFESARTGREAQALLAHSSLLAMAVSHLFRLQVPQ